MYFLPLKSLLFLSSHTIQIGIIIRIQPPLTLTLALILIEISKSDHASKLGDKEELMESVEFWLFFKK